MPWLSCMYTHAYKYTNILAYIHAQKVNKVIMEENWTRDTWIVMERVD